MLCTGATFVKKTLHLLTFRILELYTSKGIELDLSQVTGEKTRGIEKGGLPCPFSEFEKKCPNFGGKFPDCEHQWFNFSLQVQFLKSFQEKKLKIFPCEAFIFCVVDDCLSKYHIP